MHDDKLTYGKIYGQEKNLATSAIARMNLFLHGARDFKGTQGYTLRSPNYLERGSLQTFDCVVANPPFSLKNWGAEQFSSDITVEIFGDARPIPMVILHGFST